MNAKIRLDKFKKMLTYRVQNNYINFVVKHGKIYWNKLDFKEKKRVLEYQELQKKLFAYMEEKRERKKLSQKYKQNWVQFKEVKKIFVADIETDNTDLGKLKVGCIKEYLGDLKCEFMDYNELMDFFGTLKTGKYQVYFHNISFDGNSLFKWFERNGFKIVHKIQGQGRKQLMVQEDGSKISQFQIHYRTDKNKLDIIFKDTLKLFNFSVDTLGKTLGINKDTFSTHYKEEFEKQSEVDDIKEYFYNVVIPRVKKGTRDYELVVQYCYNDIEIVEKTIEFYDKSLERFLPRNCLVDNKGRRATFLSAFSSPNLVYTLMKNWVASTYGAKSNIFKNLKVDADNWRYFTEIKKGGDNEFGIYNGGYTSNNLLYRNKKVVAGANEVLTYYDITSSYPYQMTKPLPESIPEEVDMKLEDVQATHLEDYIVEAVIDFEPRRHHVGWGLIRRTNEPIYARYLQEGKKKKITMFIDKYRLLEKNYFIKVHSYKIFKLKQSRWLKPFIEMLYKLKEEGDKEKDAAKRGIAKLLLNSLYGKFAQKPLYLIDVIIHKDDKAMIELFEKHYQEKTLLEDMFYVRTKRTETATIYNEHVVYAIIPKEFYKCNNFFIGAKITSYASNQLWEFMMDVGWENSLYTDTDSVMFKTTKKEYERIQKKYNNDKLGGWKLEYHLKELVLSKQLKRYLIKTVQGDCKITLGGVQKEGLVYEDIEQAFLNDEIVYLEKLQKHQTEYGIVLKKIKVGIK